jgi:hypothetical protein
MSNRSYVQQIIDILKTTTEDAYGNALPSPALLGTLTGSAPSDPTVEQDARSWSGIAKGGIYDYTPKPWDAHDNRGTTPIAFSATSGIIKASIAVTPEPEVRHFQFRRIRKAVVATIRVSMYAPSHQAGKQALEDMKERVDLILNERIVRLDQGFTGEIERSFYFPPIDNHREFAGSKLSYLRYELTTLSGVER